MLIRFTAPGAPVTTNQGYHSAMRGGRARLMLTLDGEVYKARLAQAARAAHRQAGAPEPLEHGAVVGVRFVFPTLGTDVDGPTKFVLDALTPGTRNHPGAGIILNDNRVRHVVLKKGDCDGHPRTEVAIASSDVPGCPTCGCLCDILFPGGR